MANSKVEVGNMALGYLGVTSYATNMDSPISVVDRELARWYDQERKLLLRTMKPDFARTRRIVAKLGTTPTFGYSFSYSRPSDFIVILGIGDADELDTEYNVEGQEIQTDTDSDTGLEVRGILDVTDVSLFTPEFTQTLAMNIATKAAPALIQDTAQLSLLLKQLNEAKAEALAVAAQENKPVRLSRSRWKEAKRSGAVWVRGKK